VAIVDAAMAIASGLADIAIAGGAELLSDPPIRVRRPMRKRLVAAQKARGIGDYLKLFKGLGLSDLLPEVPTIAEFSTGLTMGETAERLAARLAISRADQDAYALLSHQRAARATFRRTLRRAMRPSSRTTASAATARSRSWVVLRPRSNASRAR
jgi:acetyl-CoA acyltransferase